MGNVALTVLFASLLACFDVEPGKDEDGKAIPLSYDVPSTMIQ